MWRPCDVPWKRIEKPTFANIIEGGMTQNLSAGDFVELVMYAIAYPWRLVRAKLKATREALESEGKHGARSPARETQL